MFRQMRMRVVERRDERYIARPSLWVMGAMVLGTLIQEKMDAEWELALEAMAWVYTVDTRMP